MDRFPKTYYTLLYALPGILFCDMRYTPRVSAKLQPAVPVRLASWTQFSYRHCRATHA